MSTTVFDENALTAGNRLLELDGDALPKEFADHINVFLDGGSTP
jgi:hypothetical protein